MRFKLVEGVRTISGTYNGKDSFTDEYGNPIDLSKYEVDLAALKKILQDARDYGEDSNEESESENNDSDLDLDNTDSKKKSSHDKEGDSGSSDDDFEDEDDDSDLDLGDNKKSSRSSKRNKQNSNSENDFEDEDDDSEESGNENGQPPREPDGNPGPQDNPSKHKVLPREQDRFVSISDDAVATVYKWDTENNKFVVVQDEE